MANDIFGFAVKNGGVFKESGGFGIIGSGGSSANVSLVQNWNISYQLQFQPVYECGTSTVYFSLKHSPGQFTCGRIVGANAKSILSNFGTGCEGKSMSIKTATETCSGTGDANGSVTFKLDGVHLSGVGASGQAQSSFAMMNVQAAFESMDIA